MPTFSYQRRQHSLLTDLFKKGTLQDLVTDRRGVFNDLRKTPIRILDIDLSTACFRLEIMDFEDKGAVWELPLEHIENYRFAADAVSAPSEQVNQMKTAILAHAKTLEMGCEAEHYTQSQERLHDIQAEVDAWLKAKGRFFKASTPLPNAESQTGSGVLCQDLQAFMLAHDLGRLEHELSVQWVSNPEGNEHVKAHRMALAEMGWVPYQGPALRNKTFMQGAFSLSERKRHILYRVAFVRALFKHLEQSHVLLYRGMVSVGPIQTTYNKGFIAASFSESVALAHLHNLPKDSVGVLYKQWVPIERLLMTFYETKAMNQMYKEAEAVLFYDAKAAFF
jgi:hypothetical protein